MDSLLRPACTDFVFLAGNRWHIDCFRCNTCNTLLDSDAHLLLLGDGSLICSNCTYSCSSCGNKIEDLAILTGDQAFCANCFKCRNCKRRIENLRYARTSQGIFCMDCHESLMQRRRKKKTAAKKLNFDKSLPSLPPNFEEERNSGEVETPPLREYSASPDVSNNRSAEQRVSIYSRVDASPAPQPEQQPQNQGKLHAVLLYSLICVELTGFCFGRQSHSPIQRVSSRFPQSSLHYIYKVRG